MFYVGPMPKINSERCMPRRLVTKNKKFLLSGIFKSVEFVRYKLNLYKVDHCCSVRTYCFISESSHERRRSLPILMDVNLIKIQENTTLFY